MGLFWPAAPAQEARAPRFGESSCRARLQERDRARPGGASAGRAAARAGPATSRSSPRPGWSNASLEAACREYRQAAVPKPEREVAMARSITWPLSSRRGMLGLALLATVPLAAQRTQTKLTATDGTAGDFFGTAVAVQGDLVVAGAYQDDDLAGSAFVFERSGGAWQQVAKLTAPDRTYADEFGLAVTIGNRNLLFVGARRDDTRGNDS